MPRDLLNIDLQTLPQPAPGRRYFLCGIGGAGMNPLAHVLTARGLLVAGADTCAQKSTAALRAAGIPCAIGHNADNVHGADVFVYSSAIADDNPEFVAARTRGIPCLHRAQVLAQLVNVARGITIAGTHGKTTTTALTALILAEAGLDPTAVVGGVVPAFNAYHRIGRAPWFVVETDESDGSFQLFDSAVAVLLNIDCDHLDFYPDLAAISAACARYVARVKPGGTLIYNADDAPAAAVAHAAPAHCIRVACSCSMPAPFRAQAVTLQPWSSSFAVCEVSATYPVTLGVPGQHNVSNALHAIAAARSVGAPVEAVQRACAAFHGVQRRFQVLGTCNGATVIDDYAHHPREIAATLRAAAALGQPLLVAFQPHRFSRTEKLLDDFVQVLGTLDRLILTDIFSASEAPGAVTGRVLFERVRAVAPRTQFVADIAEVPAAVQRLCRPGDVVLFLGAGTISDAAHRVVASSADAH
jgi:UDP-N-acetylmuramate--alanine ligase